ncbi:D-TA family PLP-dependent enzyme [Gimesia aquarii]|uniref:D-threonine aldolase n=1 Tax=Gimesia aquarii TaxID=2527964 RepID=A0A517W2H9_9PLAN|nr:D-TA family PLP-dependent enzyme [Gimesia aquarii]QDT99446.1 D-threonine aldolase [Gimesia aquarii]
MDACYQIDDTSQIISPGLIIFKDLVKDNLQKMVEIVGDPTRLRPHCKTHKMREIIALELSMGIEKHKAATFPEAEMLADTGVKDISLAYNLVGPNITRAVEFRKRWPDVSLQVTADHPGPIVQLGEAMSAAGTEIEVLLDLNTGQNRTGLEPGETAVELYQMIANTPGLIAAGLHVYDGQNHQIDFQEREAAVKAVWNDVSRLRDQLITEGLAVPRIVAGATGSFPIFASIDDPDIEVCPGTCVLHDVGYGELFPDLKFTPAGLVLTRVISRPDPDRITLDLGYKAIASDPAMENRCRFPDLPDAKAVLQNEEHLVVMSALANEFQPGDELLAIPRHICPTSALHKSVTVVSEGQVVDHWNVAARDRFLSV